MPITKYKRADGSVGHQVRVYLDGAYRYVGTYPSKAEALKAESDALQAKRAVRHRGLTLSDFREVWLADLHRAPATHDDYRLSIERVIAILGDVRLTAIKEDEMDALVRGLVAHYHPQTTRKTVKDLRAMLKAAQRRGLVTAVPSPQSMPKVPKSPVVALTPLQVARLLQASDERQRVMFTLMVASGVRRGELLGLRGCDIADGHVRVTQAVRNAESGCELVPLLKTDAAFRSVPIDDDVLEVVGSWTPEPNDYGLLFPSRGKWMSLSHFSRKVAAPAFESAGIEQGPHSLRHTYASTLISGGCSAKVLQTYLGHMDVTTTLNRYGHLMQDDPTRALAAVRGFLDSVQDSTKSLNNDESNTT